MAIGNQFLEHYTGLDLLAKQTVEGFITGLHKSPFHGFSVEFAEHRLYNSGESTKHIDWKLYARTDKLFVKRYEEETNLRCSILIDISPSMYFGGENGNAKIDFTINACASLINLLKKQRDAFGINLFNESIEFSSEIKSSQKHYQFLLSQLEKIKHQNSATIKKSNPTKVINQIAETSPRRSLIIIFSDMFDNLNDFESLLSSLKHLKHNKHEIILFHVIDKNQEINLEFENRPFIFIDKETKEEIKLNPNQIKEIYKEKSFSFTKNIKNKCAQFKIDYIEADTNIGYEKILLQYLIKRQKMLR